MTDLTPADFAVKEGGKDREITKAEPASAQYAITYSLPDGVKPDKRFNVSVKRRGVSVRAPLVIPDR